MVKFPNFKIMGFGLAERYEKEGKPANIECVGYFGESWFKGKMTYQFQITDYEIEA